MSKSVVVDGRGMQGGSVGVAGFKHVFVSVVCTAVAANVAVEVINTPDILDVRILAEILEHCGARVMRNGDRLFMDPGPMARARVPASLSEQIHGSIYLIPALLARLGEVQIGPTGGCRIGDMDGGARPVRQVIDVMERFGATVRIQDGHVIGTATRLTPAEIDIRAFSTWGNELAGPYVSGATKTAIIAGAGAGAFGLVAPYGKVDVTASLEFLSQIGFRISGSVDGQQRLSGRREANIPDGHIGRVLLPPDLAEIMTFLVLSIIRGIDITVFGVPLRTGEWLQEEIRTLNLMGVGLRWTEDAVRADRPPRIRPTDIKIHGRGIYSDHQPFVALALLRADGRSTIHDGVWRNRFQYADELIRAGAAIERIGPGVIGLSPSRLSPPAGGFSGCDLRGVAALLLAALCMDGPVKISGVEHLARGYEGLFGKLRRLGADVRE
jgi:UDP-N-acetylglucosamine 1-carboxyvinyltransferase